MRLIESLVRSTTKQLELFGTRTRWNIARRTGERLQCEKEHPDNEVGRDIDEIMVP